MFLAPVFIDFELFLFRFLLCPSFRSATFFFARQKALDLVSLFKMTTAALS